MFCLVLSSPLDSIEKRKQENYCYLCRDDCVKCSKKFTKFYYFYVGIIVKDVAMLWVLSLFVYFVSEYLGSAIPTLLNFF